MTTMREACDTVLGRLNGSVVGDLAQLDTPWTPGDDTLSLRQFKPNLNAGQTVSAGLATFYVTAVSSNGQNLTVFPTGPAATGVDAGEILRFKPVQTTRDVFDRLTDEIRALSAPSSGLFAPALTTHGVNWRDNMYATPDEWTVDPIRVISVKQLDTGRDTYTTIDGWEYLAEYNMVRIYGGIPAASSVQIVWALPFAQPTSLDTTLEEIGIPEPMQDIPTLGACATLAPTGEGRRLNPTMQGDSRKAGEIPMSANTSLAREWARMKQQRVQEERGRLARLYPSRQQMPLGSGSQVEVGW